MKFIATLIASLGFSSFAYGSYLESCNFTGDLELKKTFVLGQSDSNEDLSGVALYKITSATDKGSHAAGACERHVGETVIFSIENRAKYFGMTEADVSYFYVNSFGPNGVTSSTRYEIINLPASNDAVDVANIQTRWINMMPGPGRSNSRQGKTQLTFDATVVSTGCTSSDSFKARVVMNEGEQVLSVKRIEADLCEATPHEVTVQLKADGFDFAESAILYNGELKDVDVRMAF